jgi:hypothetical protein
MWRRRSPGDGARADHRRPRQPAQLRAARRVLARRRARPEPRGLRDPLDAGALPPRRQSLLRVGRARARALRRPRRRRDRPRRPGRDLPDRRLDDLGGPAGWCPRGAWSGAALADLDLAGLPDRRLSQDDRDAVAAALVAELHTEGRTRAFGEIIVPVAGAAPAAPRRARTSPAPPAAARGRPAPGRRG